MRSPTSLPVITRLALIYLTSIVSAFGAEIVVSSYDPPPKTLNGFVEVQPGTMVSNQFTLYPGLSPSANSIDQIRVLFDKDTPDDLLSKVTVSIHYETMLNNTPQPDGVVQVTKPGPPPTTIDLVFNQIVENTEYPLNNKMFKEVTYQIGAGIYQIFPPPETSLPVNYWLVMSNDNTKGKVSWAKTQDKDPIYNASKSASINPDTLNYTNGIGWQKPTGGDGNQIMLFSLVHAPEPSTYVLGSIVAGFLAFTARHPRFRKMHQRNAIEQAD